MPSLHCVLTHQCSSPGVTQCLKERSKVEEEPHEVKGMCVNGSQHLSEGAKRGRYNAMMKVTNAVSTVSLVKFCLSKSHID